ncbi:ABC transporter substrate-binding protein [Erwinia endophytica]|uniref:ABC transporter substrate-binding protein n=1 Tax=Erwinia endophytica TaxID=1563158 RepID=UPI001265F9D2|nr:ABC transporter substrate-binding protein [Erwinia endophytica]KAB8313804.1 ABC transporter substrate-binding protein [Erwinia endophytica]
MRMKTLLLSAITACCFGAFSLSVSAADKPLAMDAALHAQLPEKIRSSKTLNLVTDAHYPPCESFAEDNKTMVGFEPDLWNALGQVLGVTVKPVSIDFDGLIPGVKSGRFDLAVECISDSLEREKQVTFVNYAYATSEVYTLATEKTIKADPLTLCGLKVGLQTGTDFEHAIDEIYSPNCTKNGQPAIQKVTLASADAVLLALYAGRVDFVLNDAASVDDIKRKAPKPIRTINMPLMPKYYLGIVVAHQNQQLADVLHKAMAVLIQNGTYDRVMDKWHLSPMKLERPGINLTSTQPL